MAYYQIGMNAIAPEFVTGRFLNAKIIREVLRWSFSHTGRVVTAISYSCARKHKVAQDADQAEPRHCG